MSRKQNRPYLKQKQANKIKILCHSSNCQHLYGSTTPFLHLINCKKCMIMYVCKKKKNSIKRLTSRISLSATTENSKIQRLITQTRFNTPMQYTAIFHGCINVHFQMKFFIFFLFLLKTLIVGTRYITKTCPCNEHPLTPHFYIVKLGFTGVYIFSYFCSKT